MAIQISRADVSSGEILDLQSETRFLKIAHRSLPESVGRYTITLPGSNYKCDQ